MFDDLSVFLQVVRRAPIAAVALDGDEFEVGKAVEHIAKPAVKENHAAVDNNDALTEFLDVGHVMARQQNSRFSCGVMVAKKLPHRLL